MAVTATVLIESKTAESGLTDQYTSGSGITTIIDKFTATNYDASTAYSISVYLVPSGGSTSNSNLIVKTKTLQPGETYTFPEIVGAALASGDKISTSASGASVINIRSSGRLIS